MNVITENIRRFLILTAVAAGATPVHAADDEARPYLRVVDERDRLALEVAMRSFEPVDGTGPRVDLVGVAHIGDRSFYRALQEVLDAHDVVLYESVLPTGARGPSGENDEQRIASTRQSMQFVAGLVEAHRFRRRAYPADLVELNDHLATRDPRIARWQKRAAIDAWGNPLRYTLALPTVGGAGASYTLASYGADGRAGGEGAGADLTLTTADGVPPLAVGSDENLQAELASALGLTFQLDQIDYDAASWRVSDMTIGEVDAALRERGLDIGLVQGALGGTSLPMKVVRFMLKLVRVADVFFDGAIADTMKVVLIEMLGDEDVMEMSLEQLGAGFEEVIVGMRNQVTMDDLEKLLASEPEVGSVAIFYGAAHMHDFETRLAEQLGYRPAEGREPRWFRAIEVDMGSSAVSKRELNQIRGMIRQMMEQR